MNLIEFMIANFGREDRADGMITPSEVIIHYRNDQIAAVLGVIEGTGLVGEVVGGVHGYRHYGVRIEVLRGPASVTFIK